MFYINHQKQVNYVSNVISHYFKRNSIFYYKKEKKLEWGQKLYFMNTYNKNNWLSNIAY